MNKEIDPKDIVFIETVFKRCPQCKKLMSTPVDVITTYKTNEVILPGNKTESGEPIMSWKQKKQVMCIDCANSYRMKIKKLVSKELKS